MIEGRRAFKFYKSYYDVALQLPDEERYQFLMALLEMEFTGKHRELSGLAQFAFISQKHSIEAQLSGYEARITGGRQGGSVGGRQGGSPQEKEKEQVQEKEKVKAFGTKSKDFISINGKYLHDSKYIVYSNGLKEFVETNHLKWFDKEYKAQLFWKDWNGKMFNDIGHLNNVILKINNG